mgnify:CR=1 FL=1
MRVENMKNPNGTSIIDVADPRHPKLLATVPMPEGWHSHKVRVANGLMLVNREAQPAHQHQAIRDIGPGLVAQTRARVSAADAAGNVKYPNVNPLVEMTDMRDAQRSYEANLNIISATRRMIQRTLDILKA